MFQDRVVNLTTPQDVEDFLQQHPTSVVFKAGTCHKTMQGFGFLQAQVEPREDLMVGIIRVVEARPASNLISERTGIRHESPQVLLFRDGQAVFDLDNWDITPERLEEGFAQLPASAMTSAPKASRSDLTPYRQLIEQYLTGVLDDRQFEQAYTSTFRGDASLRSHEEVEVLGSIFGDVDRHMEIHMMMNGRSNSEVVRQRAEAAYEKLKTL